MTTSNTIVLKFGSSVLDSIEAIGTIVNEIDRHVAYGRRVVAIVSAIGNTTDELIENVTRLGLDARGTPAASLLSTGEAQAAALLALAADRWGLRTELLHWHEIGITARGPSHDALPVAFNPDRIRGALREAQVVVVPGFVARDEEGRPALLGRGGSDLSAILCAHGLAPARCRLVKDVPGWLRADEPGAWFPFLSWDEALRLSPSPVQRRALELARDHRVSFEVGPLGSHEGTTVGISHPSLARPRGVEEAA